MSFNVLLNQTAKKKEEPKKEMSKVPSFKGKQPEKEVSKFVCVDCLVVYETGDHHGHNTRKYTEAKQALSQKINGQKEEILEFKTQIEQEMQKVLFEKPQNYEEIVDEQKKIIKECDNLQDPILRLMSGGTPGDIISFLSKTKDDVKILKSKSTQTNISTETKSETKINLQNVESTHQETKVESFMDHVIINSPRSGQPKKVEVKPEPKKETVKEIKTEKVDSKSGGSFMDKLISPRKEEKKKEPEKKPVVVQSKPKVQLGKGDVDTSKVVVKGKSFECNVKEELSFEIIPKNTYDETINVDVKSQFKVRLTETKEDGPRVRISQTGFTFFSEQPGTFGVKVIYAKNDHEVHGSPFTIKVNDDSRQEKTSNELKDSDEYSLPNIHHLVAGFNPHTHEFYLKPNVMSNIIEVYGMDLKLKRSFEFPISAWSLCFDSEGNMYCGDNKTTFYKFDSNAKKVWSVNVPEKCALGVTYDQSEQVIYATLHKGPIFKIDANNGDIIDKLQLSVPYSTVFNIGFYKDCIFCGDKKDILIYDKYGFYMQTISGWEHANFFVIGYAIYAAQNKTGKWTKLIVDLTPKQEE